MGLGTKRFTQCIDLKFHLFLAFFIRFFVIMYGEHHDRNYILQYTDIDYHVFTDGASHIAEGGSPYERHTYRYTPFLAWLLVPNVLFNFLYGKLLFSLLDCIAAKIFNRILLLDGYSKNTSGMLSLLWLYNPFIIGISTRGSADSIMVILILGLIYFLKLRMPILSGFVLGIAIHFRIYPIMYALPIYFSFTSKFFCRSFFYKLYPNATKIRFCVSTFLSFLLPTLLAFYLYGDDYIEESFLYHIRRIDTRHNFSLFFYMFYLHIKSPHPILSLSSTIPQIVLPVAFSIKYGNSRDLPFCMFGQTFAFVTFNKVVTSQYFVWYLLFIPLILPKVNFSIAKCIFLFLLWLAAQASWLLPAYLLELQGFNTFTPLWLESIAFFCCNVGILMAFIRNYNHLPASGIQQGTRKNK